MNTIGRLILHHRFFFLFLYSSFQGAAEAVSACVRAFPLHCCILMSPRRKPEAAAAAPAASADLALILHLY